jgi:two-component system, sensor histidine kinase and response regulator
MKKYLQNLSVSSKLFLGFGIMTILLLVNSGVGYFGLTTADGNYSLYRSIALQTNSSGRVQANMLMTRIFAKNFILEPNAENIEGVKERANATLKLISESRQLSDTRLYQFVIDDLEKQLNEYVLQFEIVTKKQTIRNELVKNSLNIIGPEIEHDLTSIMESAHKDGDVDAAYLAGLTLRSLLLARLYVQRFLIQNDEPSHSRALLEFRDMTTNRVQLEANLENEERRLLVNKVIEGQRNYEDTFAQVHKVINERNNIIDNRLDLIGPQVADVIERLKLTIKDTQDELGPRAQAEIANNIQITILFSIFTLLFGGLAAYLISLGISSRVRQLTRSAANMAEGDLKEEINISGEDEIGILAASLRTMRDSIDTKVSELEKEVSERLRAEQEAAERKQVFMDSSDPIIIENLDGIVIDCNKEAERTYGWDRDELMGQEIKMIVPEDSHSQADKLLEDCRNGKRVRNVEGYRVTRSGQVMDVMLTFSRLSNEEGETTSIATIAKDISELKRAEKQLQDHSDALEARVAERTRDLEVAMREAEAGSETKAAFLASMSHEIRTPMNGVIGMVDLLMQTDLDDDQSRMMETVRQSGASLLTIINDILDFSKIEAGKLDIEKIDMSLVDVVEAVSTTLAPDAMIKKNEIVTFIDPGMSQYVCSDPTRIRQILMNLGGNAIKFSEENEILIRADYLSTNDDGRINIRFSVIDNGIGISEKAQKNLFQEFNQADNSTTRRFGGTGLGLSISKKLVELLGGTIGVKSSIGLGSEFWFEIPFEPAATKSENAGKDDLSGLGVLVASASENYRKICSAYLSYWKADIETIEDVTKCELRFLESHKTNKPLDIIVIPDAHDPKMIAEIRNTFIEHDLVPFPRFVIGENPQHRSSILEAIEEVTLMDVDPMRRTGLLTAVAVAAGRMSPEVRMDIEIEDVEKIQAPTIEEALLQNKLILLAEDNLTNQEVIKRQLNRLGYACEIANDGKEAFEMWNNKTYRLLLSDCHMPEWDGFELTAAIRNQEQGTDQHATIIAITANALQGEDQHCLNAGMDDYMSKPVAIKKLNEMLHKWMGAGSVAVDNLLTQTINRKIAKTRKKAKQKKKDNGRTKIIDDSVIKEIFGDDESEFKEVLDSFVEPSAVIIAELKQGYQAQSFDEVKEAAHKLKSSARSVGANGLADTCAALETASKENDLKTMELLVPTLDPTFDEIKNYIASLS